MLTSILLAAGESRRMGTPKALLESREPGVTILEHLIDIHSRYGDAVVVVVGFHGDRVQGETRRTVRWATNPAPERGQLSSLQCGLAAVPEGSSALFQPVDFAGVSEETVRRQPDSDWKALSKSIYANERTRALLSK